MHSPSLCLSGFKVTTQKTNTNIGQKIKNLIRLIKLLVQNYGSHQNLYKFNDNPCKEVI